VNTLSEVGSAQLTTGRTGSRSGRLRLVDYLDEKRVITDLRGATCDQVLREMIATFGDHPRVLDPEVFGAAVFAREAQASTAVGGGLAIPHARTDAVTDFVAALGRSRDGVDFGSPNGPVRIVVMMGIPSHRLKGYLRMLSHLSYIFKRPGLVEDLLEAPDPVAVLALLRRHEG